MLPSQKEEMVEGLIYCEECNQLMKKVLLARYEYVDGYPLHNVEAHKCLNCGEIFFTEEQAKQLEIRTEEVRKAIFGFQRKITVSGRSLVVSIPEEVAPRMLPTAYAVTANKPNSRFNPSINYYLNL